ncbi:MAG: hypothetical protein B6D44_04295 [Ignavibacteriales bacterium UTCHB2]|jgi:hypothetical protein|nr:MAG: hypothetical protein B6D44_04295 [Ignavibacteriales bacterium UTCHB2]
MKLQHYFKFERAGKSFTRTRYDLTLKTEPVYKQLDYNFIYFYETPLHIRSKQKRKSHLSLVTEKGFLTSVFIPDVTKPNLALGDIQGTKDLLLIIIGDDEIEIFVAEKQKNALPPIFHLFADKELDEEIEILKAKALGYNGAA